MRNFFESDNIDFTKYDYKQSFDMINKLYDETYVKKGDIWSCEYYLSEKYGNEELPRYMLDKMLFHNYNIVGKFTGSSRHFYTRLKNRKMI